LEQRISTDRGDLSRLLQEASRGNQAAFRQLYEATSSKLFGIILRITRNRSVAEEILQETFVRVWQTAERFTPEAGHPLAWLSTIARNRAIDRLRSEKFERNRAGDDGMLESLVAPDGGDPTSREALRVCLERLEDEARNCVILAYCSGYSREELAERFGRPVGTIKTILHRTIRQLRQCLDQE
jgi:RNA polymerase sigma-70 factor, ECF subfamily